MELLNRIPMPDDMEKGEIIADICRVSPFWFSKHYLQYVNNEDKLPFDQHYLIAANYPHLVYVASAEEDTWAGPKNRLREHTFTAVRTGQSK